VCIALCTIVAHNIAQNRPDSFPPYPPDDHHISDDVYLREGLTQSINQSTGDMNQLVTAASGSCFVVVTLQAFNHGSL